MSKNIRVDESVHQEVMRIAKANFRGMGDQVAYWVARDCPHPADMRDEREAHVVGTNEKIRFFFCRQCERHHFENEQAVAIAARTSPSEKKRSAPRAREIAVQAMVV